MSIYSEVYINEDIHTFAEKDLNKIFLKNKWTLDTSKHYFQKGSDVPKVMQIDVIDIKTEKKRGLLKIENQKYKQTIGIETWIESEPNKIIEIKNFKISGTKTPSPLLKK